MIGRTLTHYKILDKLGSGGMGEVYKAYDLTLDRLVAIKILSPEAVGNEEHKQRFIQEAKAASALNHPAICTIHEIGQSEGLEYIVMEYIAGQTLTEYVRAHGCDIEQKLSLALQIAEGLAKAHEAGIVHRDIKPENIMVTEDGLVKIVDFGLAKLIEARRGTGEGSAINEAPTMLLSPPRMPHITTPGMILGTVGFMSPEQAEGKPVDQRSDIFSFGAVLYELFTGEEPFARPTPLQSLHALLHEDPKPLPPDLPEGIHHIIGKALEKDPDHRYQTLRDVIADLKRLKRDTGSGEQARRHRPVPRTTVLASTMLNRRSGALLIVLALLVAMMTVSAVVWHRSRRRTVSPPSSPTARTLAILPFRNLRNDEEFDFLGFSLADAITTKLAFVHSLVVRPSSSVERYKNQAVDPRDAGEELGADAVLVGTFLREASQVQVSAQLVEVSSNRILWSDTMRVPVGDIIALQDRISEEIVKNLRLRLSPIEVERMRRDVPRSSLAYEYYLRALSLGESSVDRVKLAIELLEQAVEHDPDYAPAWMELGIRYNTLGISASGGRFYYEKSNSALRRALELNSDLPRAHLQLAQNYTELGRVEDAVGQLRKLLAINPNSPELHLGMAYALRYAGMLEESLKEAEKIEHIDPKYWRNQPRAVVNTYLYLGRYERFLESIPPVETAYTLFYRGFGYYHLGDLTRARENFRRAAQIDPDDVFSQLSQAMSFALDRDRVRGVQLLRAIEAKRVNEDVPDGEVTYKLAQVYALLGDQTAALKNLELAIRQGFFAFPYMERDPLVQTLRSHPDYFRVLEIARQRHDEFKRRFFP